MAFPTPARATPSTASSSAPRCERLAYYNNDSGIFGIKDVAALAAETGMAPADITDHPLAFVDGYELIVPWPVTEQIVKGLAVRYADAILPAIEAEEREAQQQNRWGYNTHNGTYISGKICVEFDITCQQARALVRSWCSQQAAERFDELVALRDEVIRLGLLVESAVSTLRAAGADKAADRIERDLGVPIEVVRAHAEQHG